MIRKWQKWDWGWKAAGLGILFVGLFKVWLIFQVPICAFHNDSHTYLRTAKMFWEDWHIGIHPKRSFLYPTILTLLAPLPVRLSLTILWLQHLATLLLPLITVRFLKEWTVFWRWLAFPLVLAVGLNASILFFSHDMIAEALYVSVFWFFLWKLWQFISGPSLGRCERLLWTAILCVALRPDGKMAILMAFGAIIFFGRDWVRQFNFRSKKTVRLLLPTLACIGLWVAISKHVTQQGWLFYSSVFPLTNLDSDLHQDYKKELKPFVKEWRSHLPDYPENQGVIQWLLINPKGESIGPLWDQLRSKGQNKKLHNVCRQLAVEAVLSHPWQFVKLLAYKLHFTLLAERDYARKFLPEKIGDEWVDEMKAEPAYLPLLLGKYQTWEKWQDDFFAQRGETLVSRTIAILESIFSPKWWSWAGILALMGWMMALLKERERLLFWLGSLVAYLFLTYTIGRGIPRYLLPFEPAMALGWALAVGLMAELLFLKRFGKAR